MPGDGLTDNKNHKAAQPINVAICLDENLLLPAIVLISSIAEHATADRPIVVYALTTADPAHLRAAFPALNAAPCTLVVLHVANSFGSFPRNDYITQGTYLRFLLPDLLPEVSKILYLDIDMVVNRDITPLFDEPLRGKGLAAVPDVAMRLGSPYWQNYSIQYQDSAYSFSDYTQSVLKIGFGGADDYFNAGLLLIDLDFWRKEKVVETVLSYLVEMPKLVFMDQDALSHVFAGRYVRLDTRWNAFASCAHAAQSKLVTMFRSKGARVWEKARGIWRTEPWIIHYAGPAKPWDPKKPQVPLADIWWSYAKRSPAWPQLEPVFASMRTAESARSAG